MKKLIIVLLAIPLLSFNAQIDNSNFVGRWVGEDEKEVGYMNFDKEGYAFFEVEGQILGGKEFVIDGEKGEMTYEVNEKTSPIQLDLIITKLATQDQRKLLCIVNFIDDDTMEIAMGFENVRPMVFDSENSMIFKRDK
ncbi:MAG: hypothetical protein AAF705_21745 [Bacteroidota bacterium]